MPHYPEFKELEFKDKQILLKHLLLYKRNICELNLANLFIWKDFDRPRLTVINENLCIEINPINEAPFFLEPLDRKNLKETIDTCLNHLGRISRLSEDFIENIKNDKYGFNEIRNHFDYVYLTKDLIELKGKRFDGKRNRIKKFQKNFPGYVFSPLGPKHKNEAIALFENWFKSSSKPDSFYSNYNIKAIDLAFSNFEMLGLTGGTIYYKDKMMGFILGSKLNEETISIHFHFGEREAEGVSQTLLFESCKNIFSNFKFINLEQDLGIPGLRKSKLSYHPIKLGKKFEIRVR
ncbi:MAG: phosphatidylglycerol lysyltransferase domain-containing protein [Candidatus Nanoarchaeia archaeon]